MGEYGAHHQIRNRIGAILEGPIFYPYMTGRQNLEVSCLIKDVPFSRIEEVLDWVGLGKRGEHKFKTYSLGMKQRLAIASALLTDPDVLILDEPTNGLDPQGIADIRGLIRNIAQMEKTIVLASHLLDEVQKVCSDFCVLRTGDLIYQGSVEDALSNQHILHIDALDREALKSAAATLKFDLKEEDGKLALHAEKAFDSAAINQHFYNQGVVLTRLNPVTRSLEEQFLQILKDHDSTAATH
jgi:ABC-2 type transport system ATP-binding protein